MADNEAERIEACFPAVRTTCMWGIEGCTCWSTPLDAEPQSTERFHPGAVEPKPAAGSGLPDNTRPLMTEDLP